MNSGNYVTDSYQVFAKDKRVLNWVKAAHSPALAASRDDALRSTWLRHQNTWFVGVDALSNDPDGGIDGVPLDGPWEGMIPAIRPLHPAQISVTYPGYPKQDAAESDAAHAYRVKRDAAHVDGLRAEGAKKRRFLKEPHAWILGLPLNDATASPLVVWQGSHEIMRDAFMTAFAAMPPQAWSEIDVTEIYQDARAEVFEMCHRVELRLQPGQSVLLHRMSLHGVAPWKAGEKCPEEGRMIAYFRPEYRDIRDWLRDD